MVKRRKVVFMNLLDILELAKAGYKPSDVKELIELSKSATAPSTDDTTAPTDDSKSGADRAANASDEVKKEDVSKPVEDEKEVDYKKMLAEMQEKLKASEEALKKLQDDRARTKIADEHVQSSKEIFNDAMRNFM